MSSTLAAACIFGVLASSIPCSAETNMPFGQRSLQRSPEALIRLAQASSNRPEQQSAGDRLVDDLNANIVTIISGNPNGTYLDLAYDLLAVLDDGNELRILPVVGKGGAQNLKDILYVRGIDMGITQSNILKYYEKTGEAGKNISDKLRYITRLHNEELHVLVAPSINKIEDLRGKKVNVSDEGSGTQLSARLIFGALQIPIEETNMGQTDAFEAIKRGEIAATMLIAGKPSGAFTNLQANPSEYKLLPVPYRPALYDDYLPATLRHSDYPNLIAEGQEVETIAVGSVLAVFNWDPKSDRSRRVAKFTKAFFENFDKFLQPPRHPKWKEVNLAAKLPGWTRFSTAEEMLKTLNAKNISQTRTTNERNSSIESLAPSYTGSITDSQNKIKLFKEFMKWREKQQGRQ
jgi:TRAP transporter TAXI family solute receptor